MSVFSSTCKFVSCWLLLFHLGGEHIYQKLSQTLEEVFNRLTAQHPEYQSCGSSLAAFIIEKGKSGLIVSFGEWETCSHRALRVWEQLGGQQPEPTTICVFRWAAWSGSSGDRRMQLQPALWVLWKALAWQPCHCHCQAFPAQVRMSLQIVPLQPVCLSFTSALAFYSYMS